MNYRTINLLALVVGVVCGVLFFAYASAFRESFVAAADLIRDIKGSTRGWLGISIVMGGVAGWGLAALSDRISGESYARLLLPLGLCVSAMMGSALGLEFIYLESTLAILVLPTLLLGAATAGGAITYGWIHS
jgi:hypothetical protein